MKGRIYSGLIAVAVAVLLVGAVGALNIRRACGTFGINVKVNRASLVAVRYETCSNRSDAEGYAALAQESSENFRHAELTGADAARMDVPFSDLESFFGLRVTHIQPKYAVAVLCFGDGAKVIRVLSLPVHGRDGPTIRVQVD